jgi:hypothetical protein
MEVKLDLLLKFTPFLLFRHVDSLIDIFLELVQDAGNLEGIMITNINPLMVSVKILQINKIII